MGTHQRAFGRAIRFAIARHAQELRAASVALVFVLAPIAAAAQDDSEMPDHYLGDGHVDPGENEAADLARAVQNPVANLISVPFQNNTNFDFGPRERTQNVLNIQPVVPFSLSDDWLMITRTIIPIVSQPSLFPGQDRKNGLGDILFSGFLSPSNQDLWIGGKVLWGAGPAILLPTATDNQIGPGQLGAGPSAVFLAMPGQWVIGSLFSQVWSFTGGSDVDLFTWQFRQLQPAQRLVPDEFSDHHCELEEQEQRHLDGTRRWRLRTRLSCGLVAADEHVARRFLQRREPP
jgi:hypothetical protein